VLFVTAGKGISPPRQSNDHHPAMSCTSLARGHEQHLITTMSVHFVARTRAEVDDARLKLLLRLGREQRLPCHRTTVNKGAFTG